MAKTQLVGFGISGYRSFFNRTQIGPLSPIALLAGPNNSGKSNAMRAIQTYVSAFSNSRSVSAPSGLDHPMREGRPIDASDWEIGIALHLGSEKPEEEFLRQALSATDPSALMSPSATDSLRRVLQLPSVRSNASVYWFWLSPDQSRPYRPSAVFETEFEAAFSGPDGPQMRNQLFDVLQRAGMSGDMSLQGILSWLVVRAPVPRSVQIIPATRQITATDHRLGTLPGNDGRGLPGMVMALQAPDAHEYVAQRGRYAEINAFVADVLGSRGAEISVPHNAQTIHVALDNQVLPLAQLGSGIEQLVCLAIIATSYSDSLLCIEEPEAHLHPVLQRQLVRYLRSHTTNQYLLATHSAQMIDDATSDSLLRVENNATQGTVVRRVSSPHQQAEVANRLGYRASDLVQSNAIIWVEGPSDRIYLKALLQAVDPSFLEGVHYSILGYGGRLAEHMTASQGDELAQPTDRAVDEFLELRYINRNMVFVMDSDLASEDDPLAEYKVRILDEFEGDKRGFAWVTSGRMIENYVAVDTFKEAYRQAHPHSAATHAYDGGLLADPFEGGRKSPPDKVRVAQHAVADLRGPTSVWNRGDLHARLQRLLDFLAVSNGRAKRHYAELVVEMRDDAGSS